jgi:hypothetical protein
MWSTLRFKAINSRNLALLTALSLFCAGIAWIMDHAVFGSVFFAFGGAAALSIAERRWL